MRVYVRRRNDQVILFFLQWNEIKIVQLGDGLCSNADVRLPFRNASPKADLGRSNRSIAPHDLTRDMMTGEQMIQKQASARPFFAIDHPYVRPGQIFKATDVFGIPLLQQQSFLPRGKPDDRHGLTL